MTAYTDAREALDELLSRTGRGTITSPELRDNVLAIFDAFYAEHVVGTAIEDITDLQAALDAKLSISSASTDGLSLIGAADYAAMKSLLALVIGTNVQAYDQDLKSGLTVNSKSAAYTTVRGDANGTIYHPSSDNNARTFTIDSNANVPYPVGTTLTFVNDINSVTIAITSDTLVLAGTGTAGSRTLAANGVATAVKVASTRWYISGAGLT